VSHQYGVPMPTWTLTFLELFPFLNHLLHHCQKSTYPEAEESPSEVLKWLLCKPRYVCLSLPAPLHHYDGALTSNPNSPNSTCFSYLSIKQAAHLINISHSSIHPSIHPSDNHYVTNLNSNSTSPNSSLHLFPLPQPPTRNPPLNLAITTKEA